MSGERLVLYRYQDADAPPLREPTQLQRWAQRRGHPDTRQWGTGDDILQSVTEYDSFPYRRWWRGAPGNVSGEPVVHPRIAGWYPRQDAAYDVNQYSLNAYDERPDHCWQASCTQKLPTSRSDRRTKCCLASGRTATGGGGGGCKGGCTGGAPFGEGGCGRCGGCGDANTFYAATHSSVVIPP